MIALELNLLQGSILHPFVAWNLILLQHFFPPGSVGTEVWLGTAPEDLDAIGPHLGGDGGFVQAVRQGPPWPTLRTKGVYVHESESDFYHRAHGLWDQYQRPTRQPSGYVDPGSLDPDFAGLNAPTFLPMLAALVRASARSGPEGYYAELCAEFGITKFSSIDMGKLEVLWDGLESWTHRHSSRTGLFRRRVLGGFRLIGVPKSQVILTRRDQELLPRLFLDRRCQPGSEVSDNVLRGIAAEVTSNGLGYLSASLKEALTHAQFAEPLKARLTAALDDWDGLEPSQSVGSTGDGVAGTDTERPMDVRFSLLLHVVQGEVDNWSVVPLVPGIQGVRAAVLEHDGHRWLAAGSRNEWVVADGDRTGGVVLLERAASDSVELVVTYSEASEEDASVRLPRWARMRSARTRYFTQHSHEPLPAGCDAVLAERQAPPAAATFFILADAVGGGVVTKVLQNNDVAFKALPTPGLPDAWVLLRVEDASVLGGARAEIPGGWVQAPQPRALRFAGGQRVTRGGNRYFLDYDLPHLEVDAPAGATPAPAGLELVPVQGAPDDSSTTVLGTVRQVERYEIKLPPDGPLHYLIRLLDADGGELDRLALRLAGDHLDRAGHGTAFRLTRFGEPARQDEGGASGAVLVGEHPLWSGKMFRAGLGEVAHEEDITTFLESATVLFLDALAQSETLTSSSARELLRRLLFRQAHGALQDLPDDGFVLRSLWIGGFLEVETDRKGRWRKVHAVSSTAYTLPLLLPDGSPVAAVTGTPRRAEWRALFEGSGIQVWVGDMPPGAVPVVRLSCHQSEGIAGAATAAGLGFATLPAAATAHWAGGLESMEARWREASVEAPGDAFLRTAAVFKPWSGEFVPAGGHSDIRTRLLRGIDPDTGRTALHMVSLSDGNGQVRFSFVRDQWWGRWAALKATASYYSDQLGRTDLSPWPIEYSRGTGSIWLPGRLGLPVLLTRALVLASGATPYSHRVIKSDDPDTDKLLLLTRPNGTSLASVSRIYDGFLAADPEYRTWLEYRWIPEDIAATVASKLGGTLSARD